MNQVPCTPYPELPWVLDKFVGGVQGVLEENLVGIYLVGSLATGDFDLDSDVDFLVVTREQPTEEAVRALEAMHAGIHTLGCYPAQHLEGSYISHGVLNQIETVGLQPVWYLDNGSTALERSVHDNRWHVRWVLREQGITLSGPTPASLLEPVPLDALRCEMVGMMRRVAEEFAAEMEGLLAYYNTRFGQSFGVLSCCRMLHTLQIGTIQSKRAGVQWALCHLNPDWAPLIQAAWEEREGVRYCIKIKQHADPQKLRETLEFIRYAIHESVHWHTRPQLKG